MMTSDPSAKSFELARKHLERVQASWDPPQWLDLAAYGLYAIEAAVVAAALHLGIQMQRTHWSKVDAARVLSEQQGLPEVASLMRHLNDIRKSEAYGDFTAPRSLDAEHVVQDVEKYIAAVSSLLDGGADEAK